MMAVIGGHCGVNFLSWFPVYSFHMPLFMFISGYFFHDKSFRAFIRSKAKHLIAPFLLWNFFFGLVCTFLRRSDIIAFGKDISLQTLLVEPFTSGHQFAFNLPTWFVGTLIEVQILYWCLHKLCRGNMKILTLLSGLSYGVSLYLAFHHFYPSHGPWMLAVEKVCFCLTFYQVGLLYKRFIEKRDSFSITKIVLLVIFNGILMGFISHDIGFTLSWMKFPTHKLLLPFAAALSGIYLYMQAAELLKDKISRHSWLGFIGENSFSIMTLHLFFFWLLNTVFYYLKNFGVFLLRSFNYDQYMHNIFYRISEHAPMNNVFYFMAGLLGSCLCVYVWDRYKHLIFNQWKRVVG